MKNNGENTNVYVLMSTYNGQKYVEEQIESILNQDNCNVTLIVRDDGSTDDTKKILKEYSRTNRILYIDDGENLGPAQSFLRLVKLAPPDGLYAFADQDDYWKKNKISRAVDILKENNIPLVYYSNADVVDEHLNLLGKCVYQKKQIPTPERIISGYGVQGCTMVFNNCLREVLLKKDVSQLHIGMHDYFVCDLCVVCGGHVIFDNASTMKYRQHGNNVLGFDTQTSGLKKVENSLKKLFMKTDDSIADDANLLMQYEKWMTESGKSLTIRVQNYKENIMIRIWLAASLMKPGFEKKELLKAIRILLKNA